MKNIFRRTTIPNPFGLDTAQGIGEVVDSVRETTLFDIFRTKGDPAAEPTRTFVGNIVANNRFSLGLAIMGVMMALFVLRVGMLQIARGEEYRALADANRTRTTVLPAERGIITDRNGIVLAKNTPTFTLVAERRVIPNDPHERAGFFGALAGRVGGNPEAFETAYQETTEQVPSFALMFDVAYDTALAYMANADETPGVSMVLNERRTYVTDSIPTLSHVLGYTGIISAEEYAERKNSGYVSYDRVGKQGIEAQYETLLRGSYGKEVTEVNATGRAIRTIAKEDPVNGERLTLSLDARLHAAIESILTERLRGAPTQRAAVIALDPHSGEIRALVSWPAYDANLFAKGITSEDYGALLNNEDAPLFPRAVAGEYPSGSVIKPVYAAAALTEGVIDDTTSFVSTGGLQIGNRFFPDWRAGGHGVTNVYWALADSVNTFFYIIGGGYDTFEGLGVDRLMHWAATFGFGSATGLDIPGEADGFLPSRAWKEATKGEPWYIGDTYNVSIGQGDFLVTPVQIAAATAVFANDGLWTPPTMVAGRRDTPAQRLITEDVAGIVATGMRRTVTQGSATSLQVLPVEVAGKTGTAQWSNSSPPHSWFTGFAPYDDPELVITVIVENGGDSGLAIPIAREVLAWYFSQ